MQDKVMLSMESRMRGDMQVRFGGRYEETYCRKAARRLVPSLRLGKGGTLLTLVMRLERCDSREAVRRLQNGEKRDAGSVSLSPGVGERPAVGGPLPVLRPPAVPRFASSPTLRSGIRHWSVISPRAALHRGLPQATAGRFATK